MLAGTQVRGAQWQGDSSDTPSEIPTDPKQTDTENEKRLAPRCEVLPVTLTSQFGACVLTGDAHVTPLL